MTWGESKLGAWRSEMADVHGDIDADGGGKRSPKRHRDGSMTHSMGGSALSRAHAHAAPMPAPKLRVLRSWGESSLLSSLTDGGSAADSRGESHAQDSAEQDSAEQDSAEQDGGEQHAKVKEGEEDHRHRRTRQSSGDWETAVVI